MLRQMLATSETPVIDSDGARTESGWSVSSQSPMEQDHSQATPSQRKTVGGRRTAMRILNMKHSAGIVAVYEQEPAPGEPDTRVLVFESTDFSRRLTEFPHDWHRMTEEQLDALCRGELAP